MLRVVKKTNRAMFSSTKKFQYIDSVESKDLGLRISRLYHRNSGAMIYNIRNED